MRKQFTLVCGFLWAMLCFGPAQGQGVQRLNAPARLAQPTKLTNRCATKEVMERMKVADPTYAARLEQNDQYTQQYAAQQALSKQQPPVYTIPVVFHIVGTQSVHNIATDARLLQQLAVLNADYRALNADISSVPAAFQGVVADAEIEFCLASKNPQGQPTTGIERRVTTVGTYSDISENMKFFSQQGLNAWNRDKYLNIWVCNFGNGSLGGFAYQPGVTANLDGVVLLHLTLPGAPGGAPYNEGRTATHEVGHWFNLDHPFENGCSTNANCATAGDRVCDTPPTNVPTYGCPSGVLPSACGTAGPNGIMWMNYMDYTNDACMYMFTQGQRTRMRAAITGPRASLITNNTACSATLNANFIANATTVSAGGSVNFTDQSSGGATSWSWAFQGATPATSTAQNPTNIVYNTPGTYNVSLTVTSAAGNNTETKNGYITVISPFSCPVSLGDPFTGTPTLYSVTGGTGYMSGNNSYGDQAKAELFSNVNSSDYINGASLYFGYVADNGAPSQIDVKVWDATGANGSPGAVLRTVPVNLSSISTTGATTVNFSPAIPISGNFYIGVELPTNGDTVAIITNQIGQAPAGRAWEQWSDNTWHPYSDPTGWNASVSHKISASVSSAAAVANFTATGSASICTGGTVTFNAAASTNATTYNWSFPGGNPATSTSATPTVTYPTAGNYSVTLSITGDCSASADTEVKNNFVTVTGGSPITISNPTPIICIGSSVTLTASGAANYVWTNTQTGATQNGATVTLSPTATTSYTISGSSAAGCPASGVAVIVVQNPQASFTTSANTVLVNQPVTFTNNSTGGAFNNWSMPGGNPNASNQPTPGPVTYATAGPKIVTLTYRISATCSDVHTDTIMVVTSIGLPENLDNGVVIYPNPVTDGQLTIKTSGLDVREVTLTNAIGQVVNRTPATTGDMQLDLSRYSRGIYFVTVLTGQGIITRKISVLD